MSDRFKGRIVNLFLPYSLSSLYSPLTIVVVFKDDFFWVASLTIFSTSSLDCIGNVSVSLYTLANCVHDERERLTVATEGATTGSYSVGLVF